MRFWGILWAFRNQLLYFHLNSTCLIKHSSTSINNKIICQASQEKEEGEGDDSDADDNNDGDEGDNDDDGEDRNPDITED